MTTLCVLYPKTSDSHFDYDYYLNRHIPLVNSVWAAHGLQKTELLRGAAALDGGPGAFELIGLLHFASREALEGALAAAGAAVIEDVPHFTNVQPVLQIAEAV